MEEIFDIRNAFEILCADRPEGDVIIRVTDDSYLILCGASSNRIRKVWLE